MQNKGITTYIGLMAYGAVAYFFAFGRDINKVYTKYPFQKIYKALPDYANGTVSIYERDIKRVIKDL